jgi:L-rhamnose isomerase/sugar isomerase
VDPLKALAESGYVEKVTRERADRNARSISSYA